MNYLDKVIVKNPYPGFFATRSISILTDNNLYYANDGEYEMGPYDSVELVHQFIQEHYQVISQ